MIRWRSAIGSIKKETGRYQILKRESMDAKKAYQFVEYQKVLYLSILQSEVCWDISCCIPSLWLYIDLTS